MTSKEFAEKYVGYRIEITNAINSRYGIVSGYLESHYNKTIIYEPEITLLAGRISKASKDHILLRDIEFFYTAHINNMNITWHLDQPQLPNIPDDCDDCEAKGNEPCKDTCPNREK